MMAHCMSLWGTLHTEHMLALSVQYGTWLAAAFATSSAEGPSALSVNTTHFMLVTYATLPKASCVM